MQVLREIRKNKQNVKTDEHRKPTTVGFFTWGTLIPGDAKHFSRGVRRCSKYLQKLHLTRNIQLKFTTKRI